MFYFNMIFWKKPKTLMNIFFKKWNKIKPKSIKLNNLLAFIAHCLLFRHMNLKKCEDKAIWNMSGWDHSVNIKSDGDVYQEI